MCTAVLLRICDDYLISDQLQFQGFKENSSRSWSRIRNKTASKTFDSKGDV